MAELVEPIEKYAIKKGKAPLAQFSKIGIVGAGMVGRDLAILAATHGIDVVFVDLHEEKIPIIIQRLEEELDKRIARWGMTSGEKKSILSKIKGSADYSILQGSSIVIEAVKSKAGENTIDLRKCIFKKIEGAVTVNTIIATNSSTQIITELSSDLDHPERCVSLHFSTSSPDATIVEVVKGFNTKDDVYNNTLKFIKILDKVAIPVIESPGLISVRLFIPLLNEACEILMEGVSSMEDIDNTMKHGMGMALGPFELADKIGLDKVFKWMDNLYAEFGHLRYKASPIIKKLVRANRCGRISGLGFYEYDSKGVKKTTNIF